MHRLEQEELSTVSVSANDDISDLAKSVLSTLQNIARVYQKKGKMHIALQCLRKASAFFLAHEELMGDEDRHYLYSSFEMHYCNFGMLHHNRASKPGAPAA